MSIARKFGVLTAAMAVALPLWLGAGTARAQDMEVPFLQEQVTAGKLPPLAERLPRTPRVDEMNQPWQKIGRHGGDLDILMARAKDTRMLVVYGYARLVNYTPDLKIAPDIAERVEVSEDNRSFTFHLHPGHKWSDGQPFTTEDFRYYWEDVASNKELHPLGLPPELLVAGEPPQVEILSETAVRFIWPSPNPGLLPRLAGPAPLTLYMPAHYLKQFHARYQKPEALAARVKAAGQKGWAQLHNRVDNQYDNDNPDLPTLDPWVNTTASPAERFVFVRNPYYHRVDPQGRQLPYVDRVVMQIADGKLIPAKTGAGESDLQARYLRFDNITFLKEAEERNGYSVRLWRTTPGAHLALFPNINTNDPVWRELNRDPRFRHALSLAIDREEINQVVYFGLAKPSNNTALEESPLFKEEYRDKWAKFDPDQANALLDQIGLTKRNGRGIRLLPDGRPLEIIVESAGEGTEETDILELIRDSWGKVGIALFTKPAQLDVFRNRVFAGDTVMSISKGYENGLVTPGMAPTDLAPVDQNFLMYPKWGQYHQTGGKAGEAPDLPEGRELLDLHEKWRFAKSEDERARLWHDMLQIHADQQFSIGLITGVLQPVVVAGRLNNVPEEGVYNWDPGAHFGIYKPDTFWFTPE